MKFAYWVYAALGLCLVSLPVLAADWPPLKPEDLSMKSIPQQAGAAAIVLQREQTDDNMNNLITVYERIKILTDAGRQYATVELPPDRVFSISSLSGRTVHADGSIIAFDGKAIDKTIMKPDLTQAVVKVFALPDVQVGSVIDFRYTLRYLDFRVFPPEWDVQTGLFQRATYFKFIPLQNRGFVNVTLDHGQTARGIAWAPFLGNGGQPEMHNLPANTFATVHDVLTWVDLTMKDVPPLVDEPAMPPASALRWRVYFYYQATLKPEDYWKEEGKFWNKDVENFSSKGKNVAGMLAKITSPADTPEQKVREIYAFVAALKHEGDSSKRAQQGYALEYRSAECIMQSGISGVAISDAAGCVQSQDKPVQQKASTIGADDILLRGGDHNELNRLFVAMVRAAGIPASLIWVPDRSRRVFMQQYLSTEQLDGEIAIVQADGKDVFLDPGSRFCPYGIVDWRYTSAMGLRQNPNGVEFGETLALDYKQSLITRKADLALDSDGELSGEVGLLLKGVPAMVLRQAGEKADAARRKELLEGELKALTHSKSEIDLTNSPEWGNSESPLIAKFRVKMSLPVTGDKQILLAEHLFQSGEGPRFPANNRSSAVDFHFPWQEADEIHVKLAAETDVGSLTPDDSVAIEYARYRAQQKREAPDRIYTRRDFIMGAGLVLPAKYPEMKQFFDKVKVDDDQVVMLHPSASAAAN
jgi:hypothetical protein